MDPTTGIIPKETESWVPGVPASGEARAHVHCLGACVPVWLATRYQTGLGGWKDRQEPEGMPVLHQQLKELPRSPCVWGSAAGEMGDPGTVLGQTKCLETASRSTHMLCIQVYIFSH